MVNLHSMLNLREMLDGNLARIRNVIRFSNSTRIHNESVAEHTYFTAYYALILAKVLECTEHITIDMGLLLTNAILHDIDESESGDFVRHFKYMDAEVKQHIENASDKIMCDAFKPIFNNLIDNEPPRSLHARWKNAKDPNTIEGDIVAFADFLSVLSYVMNEIDCGNIKLRRQLDDMIAYAESFNSRQFMKYPEVQAWLDQVLVILRNYGIFPPKEK